MIEVKSKYDIAMDMISQIDQADISESAKCVLFDEQLSLLVDFQMSLPMDLKINSSKLQRIYERVYNFKMNHSYDPYKSLKGIHY